MTKETTQSSRVLGELLKSAQELSAYGLVSKTDMARMKALGEEPPEVPGVADERSLP